jgi:formyl-CoA transferase
VRCKPGGPNDYLYIVIQPQVWEGLVHKIGRTDLLDNADFGTPDARVRHLEEIFAVVEEWTLTRTKWEAFHELGEVGVPCGPIMDTSEILADEDLIAAGKIVEVEHPQRGTFKTVGCPFTLSDSPVQVTRSPLLGEHNAEILQELLDTPEEELERLTAAGAV